MNDAATTARVADRSREESRVRHGAKSPPPLPWHDLVLTAFAAAAVAITFALLVSSCPSVAI